MEVGQILLVGEDNSLILGDNLASEALPARGQLPQLFQLTHSASKTHTHQAEGLAHLPAVGTRPAVSPPSSQDDGGEITEHMGSTQRNYRSRGKCSRPAVNVGRGEAAEEELCLVTLNTSLRHWSGSLQDDALLQNRRMGDVRNHSPPHPPPNNSLSMSRSQQVSHTSGRAPSPI